MDNLRQKPTLLDLAVRYRPVTAASSAIWIGLTALAYLGNVANLPLFFNVDFLFGTVVVFVILHYFGWAPAVVSAIIASAHTAVLWEHPYAVVIMTLEMVLVGVFYRRRSGNLMLLTTIYWILIGMPLVVLFYGGVMGVAQQSTVLIVFKQAINGIVNALIASLAISLIQHFFPGLDRAASRSPFTFSQAIFLLMVALVLLPAMVILVVTARAEMGRVEEDVASKLEITSFSSRQAVNAWISENLQTLRSLASYAQMDNPDRIEVLRTELHLLNMSDPDFLAMTVVNPMGDVVAGESSGLTGEIARQLGGPDLPTRPYFRRMVTGMRGIASNVVTVDGAPTVVLAVPIVERDIMTGGVLGMIDPGRLREMLVRLSGNWMVEATIVDADNRVVASTAPGVSFSDDFGPRMPREHEHEHENLYIRVPETNQNVSIMQRWQHSQYLTRDRIGTTSSWSIVLQAPIAPYQDALNTRYQSMLLVVLLVIIGTILLSAALSRKMLSSLTQLTIVAENLPDKVTRQEELDWPESRIHEIDRLINCFRVTSAHLGESFARIQEANIQLVSAKQEAEAASRTKSEFLANISHDLRTPLNGILGYAQILTRDTSLDTRTREAVTIIEKSGNHLLNLINDILDVSRIEAHKLVLRPEPFRLVSFLDDIADIVSLQARRKGLRIHADFDTGLPAAVVGDEKRLRQILLNLLNNAVKFTDAGDVWFRARPAGDRLVFEVEDTGPGIPEDQLQEIFSPFKQLSKHIQSEEGTGLGLAIVKRLVEMMGGEVSVRSRPGEGSCFSCTVRLPSADEPPPLIHSPSTVSGYEGPRRRVLVVDDKWENRSVLRSMLEPLGFEVEEAADGAQGLEVIERQKPDLVFMDLVMPVVDGFDAIRSIRDTPSIAATRVVAVSASVAESIRNECLRVGFDEFLPKPFRQLDLLETTRSLLGVVWTHHTRRTKAEYGASQEVVPPAELLDEIEQQVASGNIRRILLATDTIREAGERYAPVADRIAAMAQEFQINRLADYIKRLRHAKVGE
jgi:signal transduction histidine kinase/DNA-binding NarL/FixJ family response regulator